MILETVVFLIGVGAGYYIHRRWGSIIEGWRRVRAP